MADVAAVPAEFDEEFYLRANPDVAAAVRSGTFASGLAHYRAFGQREKRLTSPRKAPYMGLGVPNFSYRGPVPPEALRHRVHGRGDLDSFQTVGKIVAGNIHAAIGPHLALRDDTRVFDFGCGCGRVLTYLHEALGKGRFFGSDIDAEAIGWCQVNLPLIATFALNQHWPPLLFADAFFDFVFSVSIFTHLPEDMQLAWLDELRRVTKPGGWLVLTVHGEGLFPAAAPPAALADFQRKGFLYSVGSNTDGLPDFYQTAYHSETYIHSEWGKRFEIVQIAGRGIANNQDLVLCRRPA